MSAPEAEATAMQELYLAGNTMDEIGKLYGTTRQRVRRILGQIDSFTTLQGRLARREARDEELGAQVEAFLVEYRHTIEALAVCGSSRADVEERFALLLPAIPPAVVRESIDAAHVVFDVAVQEFNFSLAVIESAVWFVYARNLGLAGDRTAALRQVDPQGARDVAMALQEGGLNAEMIASVLCLAATAQAHASKHVGITLTRKRYDEVRQEVLNELNLKSRKGSAIWPPTSQTVMKRLGSGFWADALRRMGLAPGPRGRARGLQMFSEQDYESAIMDYLSQVAVTGQSSTYEGYERWVEAEDRAGRRRPSPAAVRLRYRNWMNAKRIVAVSDSQSLSRLKGLRGPATSVGTVALHHSQEELNRFLVALGETRPTEASALIERFIRAFVQEFEFRRRNWLRTAVSLDAGVVGRRLIAGSLPRAQREALTRTPEDVDAALTDIYLDRMLSDGDPRQTDGWLRADAQAELDALPDEVALQFAVLRASRHYLTHDSEESHVRLKTAIQRLAIVDPRFELHQALTRRVLIDWLRTGDPRRIRLLSACIPTLWRAMVVGETVL